MPEYLPFAPPNEQKQRPIRELKDGQQEKYDKVVEHFSDEKYEVPGEKKGPLTEDERFWITSDCIFRYLRASKWNLQHVIQRLEDSLRWRREYGLYDLITADHVEPEAVTGKEIIFGYDTAGRPAFLMIPSRQNTEESPKQLHYAVWMMERAIDLMGPGVETLALLINFADRGKNPSMQTSRTMLNIIQNHYPERLGRALIINVPFLINAFFKIIMPFVDPVTREKVRFNPDAIREGLFAKDNLMTQWWGGDRDFEWNHEKYWPTLVNMCAERRAEQKERWRKLGAKIGIDEWDIKGGDDSPATVVPPAAVGTNGKIGEAITVVEPKVEEVAVAA